MVRLTGGGVAIVTLSLSLSLSLSHTHTHTHTLSPGKCVTIQGTVVRVSNIKPLVTTMAFKCLLCQEIQAIALPDGKYQLPTKVMIQLNTCLSIATYELQRCPKVCHTSMLISTKDLIQYYEYIG